MAGVPVAIKIEGLDELQRKLQGERVLTSRLRKVIRSAANVVRNEMRAKIPRGSGRGRKKPAYRSVSVKVTGLTATITPTSPKAKWLEKGTRAHEIAPKRKRALAMGELVRATVSHPGARARPFLAATEAASRPKVVALMQEMMREIEREWSSK